MINKSAFTLLEVLSVLAILAVLFIFLSQLIGPFHSQSKQAITKNRLEEIVSTAKNYYLAHENLPEPSKLDNSLPGLPVGPNGFNLDQKYRLDGWGRFIIYVKNENNSEIRIDKLQEYYASPSRTSMVKFERNTQTMLHNCTVPGQYGLYAGALISAGPNQIFDTDIKNISVIKNIFEIPNNTNSEVTEDDIIVPIALTEQANRIALKELEFLNDKLEAFKDRYLGVDNDQDGMFDEDGCIPYPAAHGDKYKVRGNGYLWPENTPANCTTLPRPEKKPITLPPELLDKEKFHKDTDMMCGVATLDYMKAHYCDLPSSREEGYSFYCREGYWFPPIEGLPKVPNIANPKETCPNTPIPRKPARHAYLPENYDPDNGIPRRFSENACHWGLVKTNKNDLKDHTKNDQARAFIYCLFKLSASDIVDPWLSGYIWGNAKNFNETDPRYHCFFSAGPDRKPGTNDDIIN